MNSVLKRVVNNTLMLYIRQIFVMGCQLYIVKEVLTLLGEEDYGIYNLIAGFVLMLGFLNNTMSSATQRFFSYALGKKDFELLKKVYSANSLIYITIAVISIFLFETVGYWFVSNKINIDPSKMSSAKILYQLSICSFIMSVFSTPFISIIIAHERMNLYAFTSIFDVCLKVCAVLSLHLFLKNRLILYGIMMTVISFIIASVYIIVSLIKFRECRTLRLSFDKELIKKIFDFTGWTLFGCITTMFRTQAITVLINQFFNPAVIAARSVALNVSQALNSFTNSFNTGLYPPIIKAWSCGEKESMYNLIYLGCKIDFLLTWVLSIPFLFEMDFVIQMWLKKTNLDVILFARLALVEAIVNSISLPLITAARAPGKMKEYECKLGFCQLLIFPASWLLFYLGGKAYWSFVCAIVASFFMLGLRLDILKRQIELPVRKFLYCVITPIVKTLLLTLFLSCLVKLLVSGKDFFSSLLILALTFFISCLAAFLVGLSKSEQKNVYNLVKNKLGL